MLRPRQKHHWNPDFHLEKNPFSCKTRVMNPVLKNPVLENPMRGRFAPSPTGEMHLGNARTALLAWLQTRALNGRFVLRIEDIDFTRVRAGAEETILRDLAWLGLDWDEGPDVGGAFGPYRQSDRLEEYEKALGKLGTYSCSCTRKDILEAIQNAPSAPHGLEVRYSGTCSSRTIHPDRPTAIRVRVPPGEYCFDDQLHSRVCQDVQASIGDFVLRRGDGAFSYHLAVVADDIAMRITHVLRGEDLISSTPRQVFLYDQLGSSPPVYCHVPLMTDHKGERLAKRASETQQAPSIRALRESGANPTDLLRNLAQSLGWAVTQPCQPTDLLEHFQTWLPAK
jgi:glutamyl-tRNA synthetase